ncbi:hypothetical protein LA5095_06189 [Roseibium album]|uniref:Uncharacterized protein n=1 Tax=Roseibium album TaxID=311410 RepID=A0A0M7B0R8_9HYPH|nr:hypothetical protein LA5094_06159 [Roseibium album]CTQ79400.1 hypothetical protein LA5096_06170 [Roseibium album]CTQ80948.1 hypothetical protein LA5095_06189 [Roseibium album]
MKSVDLIVRNADPTAVSRLSVSGPFSAIPKLGPKGQVSASKIAREHS